MPLKPVSELFAAALAGGYSLGYFESWNLESLLGIIDAAEQTRSPVIIGFNGEHLTAPERLAQERIAVYGALGKTAAENASVPCGFIFNECPSEPAVWQAVETGFNLVMLVDQHANLDDYTRRVSRLVKFAHPRGVAVEAEIDELPCGASGEIDPSHSSLTDPDRAARFVTETGIDLLSVSVGNVHILLQGEHDLDLERLAAIRQKVNIPLGLHGGSGISDASLREAIKLGVTKVAYGTYLKRRYLSAVRDALGDIELNPHELLGMGGKKDVLTIGRAAVREAVLERIHLLGCCGKA